MSWKDLADKAMSVCRNTFATEVVYTCFGQGPVTINAVFNDPFEEGILLDGAPFQTRLYRLGVRKLDLPAYPGVKDLVTINAISYRVHEVRPDGDAGFVLLLHKNV